MRECELLTTVDVCKSLERSIVVLLSVDPETNSAWPWDAPGANARRSALTLLATPETPARGSFRVVARPPAKGM